MKVFVTVLVAIAVTVFPLRFVNGQEPSTQKSDDVLKVTSNEVRLDVVVKDKKGHAVKDLTQADFEVVEDGVSQKIQSFRFVSREGPAADSGPNNPNAARKAGEPESSQPLTPPRRTTPGVTAMVFDRLSPEARALARRAGTAYSQEGMASGDFTGVFRIDQSLITVQSFTDNSESIKAAIERATSAAPSGYASGAQKVRDLADRNIVLDQQISSLGQAAQAAGSARDSAGASAAGQASGQAASEQELNQMQSSMLEQFEALERDQQGFATINGLLAVVNPMRNLPGRKTIIFFSEGLTLPPAVQAKFPSVISAANRANVAIYTIDAAGLRTQGGQEEAARELNSISSQRMNQQARGTDRGVNGPYTKSLERNEELLWFDPKSGLGQLADQTGGFLIHDTNDLGNGLRRISDDMHGYYMLTYVPKNEDYNGQFRRINVKLSRPNLELQTRKGYYAVESVGQLPILDYEAPAIADARSARPNANPFSFHGAALSYPATNQSGLTLIIAEAPMSAFTFTTSADKKTYNADFSIVALVKDGTGQIIQKVSKHYPLTGPIESLESERKEPLLFYRETQLPAGKYTVELIAHDELANRTSIHTSSIDVAALDETKPRLSSVAVLKRAERLTPEEQKHDQPFHFGELLVYPNLGEAISKKAGQLAFFVTVWPPKGSTVSLTFVILQNGRAIGKSSAQLPAPDAEGRIKYASSVSLTDFKPGAYELQVTVSDGKSNASRTTPFTVAP
jgi:VWFA-related protein